MNWTCPECQQFHDDDDVDWSTETVTCTGCGAVYEVDGEESWDPETGDTWAWFQRGERVKP